MQYQYLDMITSGASFKENPDGSLKVKRVRVQIGIVGAPANKFVQTDTVPDFDIPASTTTGQQPLLIETKCREYITANYPNT